jgi:RNA polymerase sigma-70 factor (ECF subfamily)
MTRVLLALRVVDHLRAYQCSGRSDESDGRSCRVPGAPATPHAVSRIVTDDTRRAEHDKTLIHRLRLDDAQALNELLHRYGAWLIGVADVIVKSADLAQDIVQDVFIWLWNTRDRLEIRGNVAAYLYRAVRNRATNAQAHERAEQTLRNRLAAEHQVHATAIGPPRDPELFAQAFENAVQQALSELSPKLREIFLLRVDQEWSNAEIAEALGIAVASVHQQMYRATKMLADRLAPWLDPGE